jgi:hypothetical protein
MFCCGIKDVLRVIEYLKVKKDEGRKYYGR